MGDEKKGPADVTSLLDRMSPARRAARLAGLALGGRVHPDELPIFQRLAESLASMNAEGRLEDPEAPPDAPGIPALRAGLRAHRALLALLENRIDEALAEWEAIITEHPEHAATAYHHRALYLAAIGENEAALEDASHRVRLDPAGWKGYSQRGSILAELGRDDEAVANYLRAHQLDTSVITPIVGLGNALRRLGQPKRAAEWFTRALKLEPRRADLFMGRALCAEAERRFEDAIEDLNRALALDPRHASAYSARARCRPRSERARSLADLDEAVEAGVATPEILARRLQLRAESGDVDAAEAEAIQLVKDAPDHPLSHHVRAQIHVRRGEKKEALACHRESVRLDPDEPAYLVAALSVQVMMGDAGEVIGELEELVQRYPDLGDLRWTLAVAHGQLGELEEAIEEVDVTIRLLEARPDRGEGLVSLLHFQRFDLLRKLGRKDEAIVSRDKAIELGYPAPAWARGDFPVGKVHGQAECEKVETPPAEGGIDGSPAGSMWGAGNRRPPA